MNFDEWFQSEQGKPYNNYYEFAKVAWEYQQNKIDRMSLAEDHYDELLFALRRVFRYKGVNKEMFNAAFAYLDDLVYNHTIEQQNQKEN